MRISQMHGRGRPVFSFEFFPTKTDAGARKLMATVADLQRAHAPDFVSVTYGAGGSTQGRTLELVTRIQKDLGITAMAHMTCAGSTVEEISKVVDELSSSGIENILALRGDPPVGEEGFVATEGGFAHATELIEWLRANHELGVGAACYPEGHVESKNPQEDLHWTKVKVDKGAQFLVTQLFFDSTDYFAFVDRARDADITVPIVPGIMPIANVAQIERFTKMCGASIPEELIDRLHSVQDDPAFVMAIGIEHAIKQCRELLAGGAPGLHFYTLNKSFATRSILAAVR